MGHFRTIKDFLWENRKQYVLGIFWILLVDGIQQIMPKLIETVANKAATRSLTSHDLGLYSLYLVGLAVVVFYSRYSWRMYIMGTARKLEVVLRDRLFAHLERLSTNYFNHHKTGDLMAHATNDIYAVRNAMGPGVVMAADPPFLIILTLFTMAHTVDWELIVFSLLPLPVLAVFVSLFGRKIHTQFRSVQEAFSDLTDRVQENIAGTRVVKTFVQERHQVAQFAQGSDAYLKTNLKMTKLQGFYEPMLNFFPSLSFLIALVYGGIQVAQGQITVGSYAAFNLQLALLTWPIMAIGWVINMLQRGAASMERLNEILLYQPEIVDAPNAIEFSSLRGDVKIQNLTFSYPGSEAPALKNINLTVRAGETLAIVGRTGSGKTTLLNLLIRLYNVPQGTIFIDNHDINSIQVSSIRENVGYVPQDNFLFSQTIRDNIAFSAPSMSSEGVEFAAKLAQVHDNIVDFPDGYDTMLGERGVTLSGGQRQRVSIARALVKNPRLLFLDDSLSAVDTQTEEAILQNLKEMMKQRTSIIVSHRISTIEQADQIVVLDDGEIVEQGTHQTLLAEDGLYADMHRRQQLEQQIAYGD